MDAQNLDAQIRAAAFSLLESASLKFGDVTRTPAMQAGLVGRKMTYRMIFLTADGFPVLIVLVIDFEVEGWRESGLRLAA